MEKTPTKNIHVLLPASLVAALDYYVDGVSYRSRNHMIHVACENLLKDLRKNGNQQKNIPGTE